MTDPDYHEIKNLHDRYDLRLRQDIERAAYHEQVRRETSERQDPRAPIVMSVDFSGVEDSLRKTFASLYGANKLYVDPLTEFAREFNSHHWVPVEDRNPHPFPGTKTKKENNVSNSKVNALEQVAKQVAEKAELTEYERLKSLYEEFGVTDNHAVGTVFRFEKTYDAKTYMYVALKTNGSWYLSGPSHNNRFYTWHEFIMWLLGSGEETTFADLTLMVPAHEE